jgi:threonyl-tRNA synthetase
MIVVGEKEAESATLSVRQRGSGDLGTMKIEDFADLVIGEMEKELVK